MRVLILSQYYDPEPVLKPGEFARELKQRGHEVFVLTGFPNYPSGTLYPGFRLGLVKKELMDGIPVLRSYEFPYHGTHAGGRILNYVSFMLSSVLGSMFLPSCDVIYVWHPPLTIGVSAWLIARLKGIPFVYDVQDIWPESAVVSGILKDGWLVRGISRLERFVYRRANHILVVTKGARDNLIGKGVASEKVSVMPHWVDGSLFDRNDKEARLRIRKQYGWEGRFVVLFAGNIGLVQGLETVLVAARALKCCEDILIVFIGDGTDKQRLQGLAESWGLRTNVQFIDRQPLDRMSGFMQAADVLLVHLRRSEMSRYVIPTKTLAYLASRRPILMAMDGAAGDLVREAGGGITIPPEDAREMAATLRKMAGMSEADRQAMGDRGQKHLLARLTKEKVIPQYEDLLCRAAAWRQHK